MLKLVVITVLLSTLYMVPPVNAANFLDKRRCDVTFRSKNYPPFTTTCIVRTSVAQGEVAGTIRLPDGVEFSFFSYNETSKFNGKKNRSSDPECWDDGSIRLCFLD